MCVSLLYQGKNCSALLVVNERVSQCNNVTQPHCVTRRNTMYDETLGEWVSAVSTRSDLLSKVCGPQKHIVYI